MGREKYTSLLNKKGEKHAMGVQARKLTYRQLTGQGNTRLVNINILFVALLQRLFLVKRLG